MELPEIHMHAAYSIKDIQRAKMDVKRRAAPSVVNLHSNLTRPNNKSCRNALTSTVYLAKIG